ncbi:MAG: hypothetical protein WAW17_16785, partial [Rhodococcus sp. (in: high G+C Gram-positive bacteria)]
MGEDMKRKRRFERLANQAKAYRSELRAKVSEFAKQFEQPPSQLCADPTYVRELQRHVFDPHVKPINELVDRLRIEHPDSFVPYVAPTYGGVNARVLA